MLKNKTKILFVPFVRHIELQNFLIAPPTVIKRLAKVKFMERKKILTSKMNLDLLKRIVKCLVWSVALYAAETWTISKTDTKRIEAFEMWIWRKM